MTLSISLLSATEFVSVEEPLANLSLALLSLFLLRSQRILSEMDDDDEQVCISDLWGEMPELNDDGSKGQDAEHYSQTALDATHRSKKCPSKQRPNTTLEIGRAEVMGQVG